MSTTSQTESQKAIAYSDRLLRPFLVAAFVAVVATQLVISHASATALTVSWIFFVPVALLAFWTLVPATRTPFVPRVILLVAFAALGGVLFAIPAETFSAGFVFLAALAAGQLLESHRAAVGVAVVASVVAAAAGLVVSHLVPGQGDWWLGLTAGLPVYIGIARSERALSLEAAKLAVAESERARESEAREAALIERGRIAREIHDVLGHSLSAISIQLDVADTLATRGRTEESLTALRRARTLAKSGIGETRRAVHALQEDPKPLVDTVHALASSFGASFVVDGEPDALRVDVAQTLIRAAQESLTNAHRHAPGAALEVGLDFGHDATSVFGHDTSSVELTVTNGPAAGAPRLADEAHEGTGMGLQGMTERAELLGGTVTAGPTPSAGWAVTMRLPR